MLNKSWKIAHPVLFLTLEEMLSAFQCCVWFLWWACIMLVWPLLCWVCFLYTHIVETFYHKWILNFVKTFFFVSIEMIIWILILSFPFFVLFCFVLKVSPVAYGGSSARDWIWATAETYAAAVAMLDTLTHWSGLGIKHTPPQKTEPQQLDS